MVPIGFLRRSHGSREGRRISLKISGPAIFATVVAVLLAVLAFLNARAGVGLLLLPDARWGPGFDVLRPQLSVLQVQQALRQAEQAGVQAQQAMTRMQQAAPEVQRAMDQMRQIAAQAPQMAADPNADRAIERIANASLEQSPLNARALRMLAINDDLAGRTEAAEAKMIMVDRISRRDSVAQLWLANRSALQGDVKTTLQHIDVLLRVRTQDADLLFERLAVVLMLPEGKAAIRPFVVASTPWLERFFLVSLEKASSARPLGELVASLDSVPDVKQLYNIYRMLILRLSTEKEYDILRQVYAKLPEVDVNDLYDVSLDSAGSINGYAPAIWDFGTQSDRGAALIGPGQAEFFAVGDVRGVAATKLVFFRPSTRHELSFQKIEGEPGEESSATWRIACVLGDAANAEVRSNNLLEMSNRSTGKLTVPQGCDAATLELIVDGGTRRLPTRLVLANVRLSS